MDTSLIHEAIVHFDGLHVTLGQIGETAGLSESRQLSWLSWDSIPKLEIFVHCHRF